MKKSELTVITVETPKQQAAVKALLDWKNTVKQFAMGKIDKDKLKEKGIVLVHPI